MCGCGLAFEATEGSPIAAWTLTPETMNAPTVAAVK